MKKRKGTGNLRDKGRGSLKRIWRIDKKFKERALKRQMPNLNVHQRIKYIHELESQKQKWEKMWKSLADQAKLKRNQKNKSEIEVAMKECEENFEAAGNVIKSQKEVLEAQLRME